MPAARRDGARKREEAGGKRCPSGWIRRNTREVRTTCKGRERERREVSGGRVRGQGNDGRVEWPYATYTC